jgi:signal transduction histidine kinase
MNSRTLLPLTVEDERERVRQVLHDGLGQLLTSISFLAGGLRQKLETRGLPEAEDAAEILQLVTQAIGEAQAIVVEAPTLIPVPSMREAEPERP